MNFLGNVPFNGEKKLNNMGYLIDFNNALYDLKIIIEKTESNYIEFFTNNFSVEILIRSSIGKSFDRRAFLKRMKCLMLFSFLFSIERDLAQKRSIIKWLRKKLNTRCSFLEKFGKSSFSIKSDILTGKHLFARRIGYPMNIIKVEFQILIILCELSIILK